MVNVTKQGNLHPRMNANDYKKMCLKSNTTTKSQHLCKKVSAVYLGVHSMLCMEPVSHIHPESPFLSPFASWLPT